MWSVGTVLKCPEHYLKNRFQTTKITNKKSEKVEINKRVYLALYYVYSI